MAAEPGHQIISKRTGRTRPGDPDVAYAAITAKCPKCGTVFEARPSSQSKPGRFSRAGFTGSFFLTCSRPDCSYGCLVPLSDVTSAPER